MIKTIVGVSRNISPERIGKFVNSVTASGYVPRLVDNLNDIFTLLNKEDEVVQVIGIDLSDITELRDTSVYDILNTIRTVCSITNRVLPPIVIYSYTKISPKYIRELIKAGIKGIVFPLINFTEKDNIEMWKELIAGRVYLHKEVQEIIKPQKKLRCDHEEGEIVLTPRQKQVLNLICTRGASNKIIARLLDISESTVKLHTGAILRKYGLTNRTQLALFTSKNKITA